MTPAVVLAGIAAALLPGPLSGQSLDDGLWVLRFVGSDAVLADVASIQRDGDSVRMRSLLVFKEDVRLAGPLYWGGAHQWTFDCRAGTADLRHFAFLMGGGNYGEGVLDRNPPYAAATSRREAALLAVACDPASAGEADADNLEDAVRVGRAALRLAN